MAVRSDGIRIVPVHRVDELAAPAHDAAPAARPQLTYRGGPLLGEVEVFTVLRGDWWSSGDGAALAGEVNAFFDAILGSELLDQLAEYGLPGTAIGHGTRTGTARVAEPALGPVATDDELRRELQGLLAAGTVPPAGPNALTFLYLPPNVAVSMGGGRSCSTFCGYHDAIGDTIFYAVMPYPGCAGCAGGLSLLDALTSTSSHELCEAITDPVPGTGWYDDVHGEIGDICAWQTKQVAGSTVQLEWSNAQGACV